MGKIKIQQRRIATHKDCAKTGRSAGLLIMLSSTNAICRKASLCRVISISQSTSLSGLTLIVEIEVVYDAFVLAAIVALVFLIFEESFAAVHWRPLFSSSHPTSSTHWLTQLPSNFGNTDLQCGSRTFFFYTTW